MALSGLALNDDLESVFQMNDRLNRAGMDTISAGGTIAFAIECYEKGLITKDEIGKEIKFGDFDSIVYLLDIMSLRKNALGDLLLQGVKIVIHQPLDQRGLADGPLAHQDHLGLAQPNGSLAGRVRVTQNRLAPLFDNLRRRRFQRITVEVQASGQPSLFPMNLPVAVKELPVDYGKLITV